MPETLKREEPGDPNLSPTFAVCAAWYIELRRRAGTSPIQTARWERTLTRHAYPRIGSKCVDQITQADIMAVLEPLWVSKQGTGLRVRQQAHTILEWAAAQGYRSGNNPANSQTVFQSLSPVSQTVPRQALSYTEIPAALRRVTWSTAHPPARWAFALMTLTATRPGDVRFVEWAEIDRGRRIWTLHVARTKRHHHIPLSNQAMRLLEDAWDLSGPEGIVFPADRSGDPMSDATLLRLLQRLDIPATPSGFRRSFHAWCVENGVPPMLVKAILSRTAGRNSGQATFLRTDTFKRMRELMQAWGDFCLPNSRALREGEPSPEGQAAG